MNIKLVARTVREVCDGYVDSDENGVVGFGGKLNIRPAFQREFVYDDKKRNAVIETILKGFPLNVMYWCKADDGTYELLDGQQRTISICQYVNCGFSLRDRFFNNITVAERNRILDYELMIYECEGTDEEKLDWFKTINIAGERLLPQELRNAVYTGKWLSDAKRYFSKTKCPAYSHGGKLLSGKAIRQDYLETAIRWLAASEGKEISRYMAEHQHDNNASKLWIYFQSVISWVNALFPTYRKEMQGLDWGIFYNKYSSMEFDVDKLAKSVDELMLDDEVTNKKGIYEYVLSGNERALSLRTFSESQRRTAYEKQDGVCVKCRMKYPIEDMQADHIRAWSKGGKTTLDNCQMLCSRCNAVKSDK